MLQRQPSIFPLAFGFVNNASVKEQRDHRLYNMQLMFSTQTVLIHARIVVSVQRIFPDINMAINYRLYSNYIILI